jgi:hypothetical protein
MFLFLLLPQTFPSSSPPYTNLHGTCLYNMIPEHLPAIYFTGVEAAGARSWLLTSN